ncbi:MAG: peptidoglycan DD-metalloendopeptidase family protein [Hyphomicrobiaceae bacterium]|nr:MAG: peptidoglycan DD-metalloendopeptidase family protein [Hyphomicrobiaceae bacterium]
MFLLRPSCLHQPRLSLALAVALALGGLAICAAPPAPAQTNQRERVQKKIEADKEALKSANERESSLQRDVQSIEQERARIASRLVETAKLVQKSEAKLTEIEARIEELKSLEGQIRGTLAQRHGQLSQLLAAMQRMGRNPPPVMITGRKDALKMVRSAMLLASVYPELSDQAVALNEKLTELVRVMGEAKREGDQLRAETTRITEARQRLEQHLVEKRTSLFESQAELKQARQAAAELATRITDLNELMARLEKSSAEKDYERELAEAKAREAAQLPKPVPSEPQTKPTEPAVPQTVLPESRPPAERRPAVTLKPTLSPEIAMVNPGRLKPAIPFEKTKGKLPLPARGRRLVNFGDKTDISNNARGIVIETRAGAQVTAPADAWVLYAGRFRTYEQILILNAGGGYYFVLAGLARSMVQPGNFVLAGEPVGVMGDVAAAVQAQSRSKSPASQEALPAIYIELRKDGRPIDPDPWWAAEGTQKVQG